MAQLGWLDSALFVNTLFDRHPDYRRARALVGELQSGESEGWLDLIVLHELTYVLSRLKFPGLSSRAEIAQYVQRIIVLDSVHVDAKDELIETLALWAECGIGFADARLTLLASRRSLPVCSPNVRDFPGLRNTWPGG